MKGRVLVVDDEEGIRSFLVEALAGDGHEVVAAEDGRAALARLEREAFHLLITDLRMPGMDGMELLGKARGLQPDLEVIVLTAHGTVETAVEAMRRGAYDYLQKPLSGPDELRLVAARALERRRLLATHQGSQAGAEELVARDPAMRAVLELLDRAAPTDATVLLSGESGTGKELAARRLHAGSHRAAGPFVPVNCAALSASLLESELLGHEKGAFTGALAQRRGRFELADGGTLFLDEVSEIRPELQAKLLRVLQERRFERVGGARTIQVDVRIVAATNRDLQAEMAAGRFREDLFHRLAVIPVRLPALRERPADVPALAEHLLRRAAARLARPDLRLAPDALAALGAYPWPGNVRELGNALERAAILAREDEIHAADLLLGPIPDGAAPAAPAGGTLAELERQAIVAALQAEGGHRKRAAARLGIGLRTLYDKLKAHGLGE
ncbi:MAG TPA: sigma-54 dependent transcriptional regulator [Myxococcota bacterium]|nr:sigma-54 dependent transcriptional regulator [Myxococcota bacterium]HRY93074.1 sigma-54 dependent transcriptional regulator [Myxococcota bacterium]HSA20079.1 sigma-54 dependent transcriptional regulator [Myxococcota bacterium]